MYAGRDCIIASFDDTSYQITGPAGAQYQYDPLNVMTEVSALRRHYIYILECQRIATVNDGGAPVGSGITRCATAARA